MPIPDPMISFRVGVLNKKILQFQVMHVHTNVLIYMMIYHRLEFYSVQHYIIHEGIRFELSTDNENLLTAQFSTHSTERDFTEYPGSAVIYIPVVSPSRTSQITLEYHNTTRQNAVVARIIAAIMQLSADVRAWNGRAPLTTRRVCQQPLYEF